MMIRNILVSFLIIFTISTSTFADEKSIYEVESAFVFKFIKFVTWPEEEKGFGEEIDLCYVGKGEIKKSLNKLDGLEVKNRKIKVSENIGRDNIKSCQIVFIDINIISERKRYIRMVGGESILTISHHKGFIDDGGMINLIVIDNKLNFEINFNKTQKSNLKVSSKLLKLAQRIISDNGEE